jgi:hypothetical protein
MMSWPIRRGLNTLAALCIPFFVQALWLVINEQFHPRVPESLAGYHFLVSAALGFLWVAFEYRLYSIPIALVYFPVMYYLLIGFSFAFVGWAYHDWL